MKRIAFLCLSVATILAYGCAPTNIGTKSEKDFSEDLSAYQIQYSDSLQASATENEEPVVGENPEKKNISGNIRTEFDVTDSLNAFLNRVAERNRENNVYQGITIQVYSGSNRSQANEAKNKVYEVLENSDPRLVYEQPNYKVKVGRYTDRLEAQKDYATLSKSFPLVLVVPEQFKVVE